MKQLNQCTYFDSHAWNNNTGKPLSKYTATYKRPRLIVFHASRKMTKNSHKTIFSARVNTGLEILNKNRHKSAVLKYDAEIKKKSDE